MPKYVNKLVENFPEYLFNQINYKKLEARQSGKDIIDLGYGNPDIPTNSIVVDKLIESAKISKNHKYSVSKGIYGLRNAISKRYKDIYKVDLDPDSNIVNTIGSKEGLTHLLMSILDEGDNVIVQDPSYPIHHFAPLIARGNLIKVNCLDSDKFLEGVKEVLNKKNIKVLLVSFPHNPTTISVDQQFFDELILLAKTHDFLVINDFAYSDVFFSDARPPSLLQSDKNLNYSVELYSLTKGYSMAGWRVGFALGNKDVIGSLTKLKSYIDYGTFQPIQIASTVALRELNHFPIEVSNIYKERRDIVVEYLSNLNFTVQQSGATMFVWAELPEKYKKDSIKFSLNLIESANLAVSPGIGFGECGEGFIRIALVENKQRIRQAMKNVQKFLEND